jgi:purine-binding chemotaxis protein CheW
MSFDLADFSYSRQRAETRAAAQRRHFTIKVKSQTIGLPVDCVKTIFHVEKLTPAPLAPPEIAGLANLRGRIVTVLRLDRCLFLGGADEESAAGLAVGVEHNGDNYALLIDETGDVVVNDESDLIVCPAHIDERLARLMAACYRREDGFLSILDMGAVVRSVSRHSEVASRDGASRTPAKGAGQ